MSIKDNILSFNRENNCAVDIYLVIGYLIKVSLNNYN